MIEWVAFGECDHLDHDIGGKEKEKIGSQGDLLPSHVPKKAAIKVEEHQFLKPNAATQQQYVSQAR